MAIDETVLTKGLMKKLNALLSAATSLEVDSHFFQRVLLPSAALSPPCCRHR